jgi:hypothetical protein
MTKGLFSLFQPRASCSSRLVSHPSFSFHSFYDSSVSWLLTPVFTQFCIRILRFKNLSAEGNFPFLGNDTCNFLRTPARIHLRL